MKTPFEQFEIISVVGIKSVVFVSIVIIILMKLVVKERKKMIPKRWEIIVEKIINVVGNIVKESIGSKKYLEVLILIMGIVLIMNISGIVPYWYTITGQMYVCMILSIGVWLGKTILGIKKHGVKIMSILVPEGVPFIMVGFFVLVELVGYIIPMISLGVRLFANMMSGHVLLNVLFGMVWLIVGKGGIISISQIIPLVVLNGLILLEVGVALIQGYVFVLLISIYLGDMEKGGH